MKKAKQNHIEQLFDIGKFIYDEFDLEKNIIELRDGELIEVAEIDLKNQKFKITDTIFIGDKEYLLNEDQKDFIFDYMQEYFEDEIQSKEERRKEKQETPYHDLNN